MKLQLNNQPLTGLSTTLPKQAAAQKQPGGPNKELQATIYHVLMWGVSLSAGLMLLGLVLDPLLQKPLPTAIAPVSDIFQGVLALQPSGFLMMGLLVLIATPIINIFGAMITFIYERDWRYAGVTLLVFLIVVTSILFGRG